LTINLRRRKKYFKIINLLQCIRFDLKVKDRMVNAISTDINLFVQDSTECADLILPIIETPNEKRENLYELNILPPEILIKIMQYLPTADILLNVTCTSWLFKELTDTSLVHTHVYFPADMKIDKKIAATCKFLETALQLKSITIFCKKSYNVSDCSKLLKAVSGHSNLQQVNITGMFLSMSSLKSLTKTGMFARLTKLVVKIKVDSHQRCLVEILASFKNLYHLELTGLKTWGSKSLSIMALTCSNLNTLITDCHISATEHISILKYRHNKI
jgi:hypothetical protein